MIKKIDILKELEIESINPGAAFGDSNWSKPSSATLIPSIEPATGEVIASVSPCSEKNYEKIIQDSYSSFLTWREVPAPKRGELVRRIGLALRDKKDALGSLVSMEMGKIKEEGDGEVQEMIDMSDFAVGQSRMLYGKTMHSERYRHRMYEQWHPLGIVGIISAFNFPVAVWAWNAFVAAITGNTVVWKPSRKTPLCAIAVQKICDKVCSDMGYSSIFSIFIPPDRSLADHFVKDKRVSLISFTGSTAVGKEVGKIVAERLGKSILELSGNNPIIVDETANFDIVIPAIVFGAVGTAGQRCTTTRRVLVHKSIKTKLIEQLQNAYQQVAIGNPLNQKNMMGPLIDEQAVEIFQNTIKELRALNAEICHGGSLMEGKGFFVTPTLVIAKNDWPMVQNETFAPILYIIEFETFDEAIRIHNQASHGLSSALFTTNLQRSEQYLSSIGSDCGIANINIGTSGAEIGGAFGGEKDTGGGREAGSDAWKAYMRRQTTTINWSNELPLSQGIKFGSS